MPFYATAVKLAFVSHEIVAATLLVLAGNGKE